MTATVQPPVQSDVVSNLPGRLNIADRVRRQAELRPFARAVVVPGAYDASGRRAYSHVTFRGLDQTIDRWARGLSALGVAQGTRVLLFVKPSIELFGLAFALFRLGAVPVLIDPAMGKRSVLGAIAEVEPEAVVAITRAHLIRLFYPSVFKASKVNVTVGRKLGFGGFTLEDVEALGEGKEQFRTAPTRAVDLAAILFTSGSTGAPKGVLYTHGVFDAQVDAFERDFKIEAGEVDLSAFPLFSLFSVALGVTVVVPDMDPTKQASVDPKKIVEAVEDQGVTYAFGSPAFWRPVSFYCEEQGILLSSLRRALMAGAPAPISLLERMMRVLPEGADVYTPYGATECLPITLPSARALLAGPAARTAEGKGTCVGAPLEGTQLKILEIRDEPIATMDEARELGPGEIGEIAVSSPVTTGGYFRRPEDDARSKISDGARLWHRMGDVGYLDQEGRLWFCGRKAHRVEATHGTMFSVCCEAIFEAHPRVYRAALVGIGPRGTQRPVIVLECLPDARPKRGQDEETLRAEILKLGASSPLTESIRDVLFHDAFPVDARHNAKIRREELAVWAARVLGAT